MRKSFVLACIVSTLFTALLSACAAIHRPYRCTDPLGCLEIPPGGPVIIGTLLATSGDYATAGVDSQRAIALAISNQGLIHGHGISLFRQGTDCSAQNAGPAATMLSLVAQMVAVIGPTCSEEVQNAVPILTNSGQVVISPSAGGKAALPGFYHNIYPAALSGTAARFAIDRLDARRAITITDHQNDSDLRIESFAADFSNSPGASRQVLGAYDMTDFQASLPGIVRKTPDVIYISAAPVLAGQVVTQLKATPGLESAAIVGSENLFSPDFLQSAGKAARGVYLVSPDISGFRSGYASFLTAYAAQYAQAPISVDHAYAFDAVNLLVQTIRQTSVADPDGRLFIPRLGLRRALSGTRAFPGLTGELDCSASGDCTAVNAALAVYQVIDPDPEAWDPGINPKFIYLLNITK
jgi:branched-chain amino acid transport system substrate-binding protein